MKERKVCVELTIYFLCHSNCVKDSLQYLFKKKRISCYWPFYSRSKELG